MRPGCGSSSLALALLAQHCQHAAALARKIPVSPGGIFRCSCAARSYFRRATCASARRSRRRAVFFVGRPRLIILDVPRTTDTSDAARFCACWRSSRFRLRSGFPGDDASRILDGSVAYGMGRNLPRRRRR
ncbi:hypothetical protein DFH09DRAFT_1141152 [Mycena vulgaris]|nr:hypothetical protein DFH09DRAFT_1141152 [Mycena vulgaris]